MTEPMHVYSGPGFVADRDTHVALGHLCLLISSRFPAELHQQHTVDYNGCHVPSYATSGLLAPLLSLTFAPLPPDAYHPVRPGMDQMKWTSLMKVEVDE
jgi:hypothetical protein